MSPALAVSPHSEDGKGVNTGDSLVLLSFSFSILGAASTDWHLCHRLALCWPCYSGHCPMPRTAYLSTKVICIREESGFREYPIPANSDMIIGILDVLTEEGVEVELFQALWEEHIFGQMKYLSNWKLPSGPISSTSTFVCKARAL